MIRFCLVKELYTIEERKQTKRVAEEQKAKEKEKKSEVD